MKFRFLIPLLAAALAAGCSKEATYDTTYVLKPLRQTLSNDPIAPFVEAKAYVYNDIDTALWTVATYQNALDGVLTSKVNSSQTLSTPTSVGIPYQGSIENTVGWLQMPIGAPIQMILVVDPVSRVYAYTSQPQILNLPALYVSVVFKAWKAGFSYKDGVWSFYNNFYVPPQTLKCYLSPKVQTTENGAEQALANATAYAYAVDTTAWRITSYADALAGKITSKEDAKQTRTEPNFKAFPETSGVLAGSYVMNVTASPLMLVVVDPANKLYAYTKQTVDLIAPESPNFPVVLRPWKQAWIGVEGGWVVVDDARRPQTPAQAEITKR